ncbi:MAG: MFS transporter, partial [Alphaproteobacteria bacterium]|nr:MFS transporter [Alphaproteobacteria bacterium]
MSKQVELLGARRFLPLLLSQTLGAFNDNLFKSAFIMLITYGAAAGPDPGAVAALAGGALIAPFFLFSATAGQLADRFERSRLLQILKGTEIVAVFGAGAALLTDNLMLSLVMLFVLGTQAAFTSPIKYSLLPQHLATAELVDGNALMEAGTFLSILAGTIAGGVAVAIVWGPVACCLLLVVCAALGFAASLRVPTAPAPSPGLRVSANLASATAHILRHAWERRDVRLSILGASWFWLVGAVSLSQLPSFAKLTLGADSSVVVLFLAAFSIGVGVGSSLCGKLMHGEVSARYVPLAALGMTIFSFDLGLASHAAVPAHGATLIGVVDFLSELGGLRIFGDLLGLAVSGGFFVVPLYAIIQNRSDEASRARIIAANNVVNALFMAGAAAVTAALIAAGLDTPALFLILGVANALVTVWICKLLPRDVLRLLARTIFRLAYRVEVAGLENVAAAGDRVIIVPNHVSFLDAPLVAAFLPGVPVFAIDPSQMQRWWVH